MKYLIQYAYYTGNLAFERRGDPALHAKASEMLLEAETGAVSLVQLRIARDACAYLAIPAAGPPKPVDTKPSHRPRSKRKAKGAPSAPKQWTPQPRELRISSGAIFP